MDTIDLYIKDITGKDEAKAQVAAQYLVDNSDVDFFERLIYKSEFLFDFIKANICKRINKAINKTNFRNILNFFTIYSSDYDELFAEILAKHATQELTDEIFELLEKGTDAQKAYCAKYFTYIPDTVSIEDLQKYAFSQYEPLALNSAQALGIMRDDVSFDIAMNNLSGNDDFEKLQAVKFFVAYENKPPLNEIFEAMKTSNIPENIAGEIPYIAPLTTLYNDNEKNVLITFDNILSGLGEILPLSQIFQFELFEMTDLLISKNKQNNRYKSKISQILLKEYSKIKMFCENDEYIFDEDNNTKQELSAVLKLLQTQTSGFWNEQKKSVLEELDHCRHRISAAIDVIIEYNLKDSVPKLKELLLSSDNDLVICKSAEALFTFGALNDIDKTGILNKVENDNIKALISTYWSNI